MIGPKAAGLVAALGTFAVVVALPGHRFAADSFMNLYAGEYIAQHGLPRVDGFTVEGGGRRWIDQQWLAHLAFYGAWRAGGYAAVATLSSALVAAGYGLLCWLLAVSSRRSGLAGVLSGAALAVGLLYSFPRSQAFAFLLFPCLLALLTARTSRERIRLTLVGLLLIAWANLHGSVLLGAGVATLWCMVSVARATRGRVARSVAAVMFALAPLATPYGRDIVRYYTSVLGNDVVHANVAEWGPLSLSLHRDPLLLVWVHWSFVLAAVATVVGVMLLGRRGRRPTSFLVAVTAGTAILSVREIRNEIWFAMVAALLVADLARIRVAAEGAVPLRPGSGVGRAVQVVARWSVPALCVVGSLAAAAWLAGAPSRTFTETAPVEAIDDTARLAGRERTVLADTNSASALLWMHPELRGRVGLDPRLELFAESDLVDYYDFMREGGSRINGRDYDITIRGGKVEPSRAG